MRRLIINILKLFCASLLLFCTYISWYGLSDALLESDLIVVFGNEVYSDGSLSPRLKARMDKGIELAKTYKHAVLFVSGAVGKSGVEESAAMKQYAVTQGVADTRVVADPLGANTHATAKNAAQFMREHNLKSAMLVSQFFHLARATLAFKNNDVWTLGHAHADYFEFRDFYSTAREMVALPAYALGARN